MDTLILGIGNPILTDDGVGIRVAERIREERPDLDVKETSEVGLTLLELVSGYRRLVMIDAVKTGKGKPGELYELTLDNLQKNKNYCSLHGIDMATVLELGQKLGYNMPELINIYGIEIQDDTHFGERCTEEVEERIPAIIEHILAREKL